VFGAGGLWRKSRSRSKKPVVEEKPVPVDLEAEEKPGANGLGSEKVKVKKKPVVQEKAGSSGSRSKGETRR
jgi:hypothetical protein